MAADPAAGVPREVRQVVGFEPRAERGVRDGERLREGQAAQAVDQGAAPRGPAATRVLDIIGVEVRPVHGQPSEASALDRPAPRQGDVGAVRDGPHRPPPCECRAAVRQRAADRGSRRAGGVEVARPVDPAREQPQLAAGQGRLECRAAAGDDQVGTPRDPAEAREDAGDGGLLHARQPHTPHAIACLLLHSPAARRTYRAGPDERRRGFGGPACLRGRCVLPAADGAARGQSSVPAQALAKATMSCAL